MRHAFDCPMAAPDLPPGKYVCNCGALATEQVAMMKRARTAAQIGAECAERWANYYAGTPPGGPMYTWDGQVVSTFAELAEKMRAMPPTKLYGQHVMDTLPPLTADQIRKCQETAIRGKPYTQIVVDEPAPEVCTHATPQMRTEWKSPDGSQDSWQLKREQQRAEIRRHYTRNMREWPTCKYGGTVELRLVESTDTNDPGPMVYTYGLVCPKCAGWAK